MGLKLSRVKRPPGRFTERYIFCIGRGFFSSPGIFSGVATVSTYFFYSTVLDASTRLRLKFIIGSVGMFKFCSIHMSQLAIALFCFIGHISLSPTALFTESHVFLRVDDGGIYLILDFTLHTHHDWAEDKLSGSVA